jgi:hypothetical protein
MILAIVVSLSCYIIGLKVIQANYPKLAANLMTGYALLVGIGGCLLSAVVTAKSLQTEADPERGRFFRG